MAFPTKIVDAWILLNKTFNQYNFEQEKLIKIFALTCVVILFSLFFLTFYLFGRWNPSFNIEIETAQLNVKREYILLKIQTLGPNHYFYLLNELISFYWVFPLLVVALNLCIYIPVITMMMYNWTELLFNVDNHFWVSVCMCWENHLLLCTWGIQ